MRDLPHGFGRLVATRFAALRTSEAEGSKTQMTCSAYRGHAIQALRGIIFYEAGVAQW